MCIRDRHISVTTKEVIGMPTMGVETKLLNVPELIEAPEGKVAEDEVTQEVVDENQTKDVYKRQVRRPCKLLY